MILRSSAEKNRRLPRIKKRKRTTTRIIQMAKPTIVVVVMVTLMVMAVKNFQKIIGAILKSLVYDMSLKQQ